MHDFTLALAALVLSGIAAWALTFLVLRYATARELLDHPNHRSSHSAPTPRGGGLSIVLVVLFTLSLLMYWHKLPLTLAVPMLCAGATIALVGFIDDHQPLASGLRFAIQFLTVAICLIFYRPWAPVQLGNWSISSPWLLYPLFLVGTLWMSNLYNFMDGIDGIAGIEAVTVALAAAFVKLYQGELGWAILLFSIGGSSAGFLYWNWSPARIFMGDVGSGFLGLMFAFCLIGASAEHPGELWSWIILLGVFVADATTTLIKRLIRREHILSAHNSHAYQRLARRFGSHRVVTIMVLVVNIVWLMPLSLLAAFQPDVGWLYCLLALSPLVLFAAGDEWQTGRKSTR